MRLSKYFVPTLKEVPNDAVVTSHILMLRTGMIRMVSAGIYSFLPLGYIVMKKISEIIREEMDAIGGQEFHLPALNPKEIWEETGRVEAFGDILFHIKNRDYVLAPTHEEIVTYHARNVVKSYKDMPQIWYQIQTKFRNEPRPRSGVIRGRQFLMKDSYTFDNSWEALDRSYNLHDKAYRKIFDRCRLKYFVVGASSGAMGGTGSEEFMVKSDAGEDTVAYCESCGYAANVEVAASRIEGVKRKAESKSIYEISTPDVKSIDELCAFLKIDETQCAKSRIYVHNGEPVLILMLGNDEVNESKLVSVLGGNVRPGHPDELKEITGADAGSIGPMGFRGKIIADHRLKDANNMFSGANKNDYHIGGIDFQHDVKNVEYQDLRIVKSEEGCPKCEMKLEVFSAIELGHIFKLGTKYSEAMAAKFIDEKGEEHPIIMGSYGIGVERIMACFIEQHHDDKGIVWEKPLAPFDVHLIALNMKNESVASTSEKIYNELMQNGISVLFDDREAAAGFKFNDADLLGMPIQIVIGEKKLKDNKVELKIRKVNQRLDVDLTEVLNNIKMLFAE
ncbi:MAG: proline--tRNA ligase [Ignavibacteria bacterium RIFOXYB2_FULL_35_12]|nr:MAG: proline--tRNA ligase [Ignavibacteria bacterium GWF2_35_20]OGU78608.1 MAG: proline--tRNA ligase [Ignavibacteria bacterium RIFOXYA2_FULL_35_9]OGU88316.1 MAG: proline--tRNA ligase [Ignavibacteria bacterium RIFOXYC12_FULL_35_11]OGU91615.1 MAG: proline--tRNA ligase [Ignavibacteria bacterium RIFOXYA12_FULL_35_25]OGU97843.1 MAG: proline--tRNA ligase [Ignavibacteria bacterium RIFOXYB12_FULL_35_14]OGV00051.1 MAG: proline--tRNA ligase [Ignavibacteria bacterium RIFOXYC2_FULL_35_16]OGV04290.1 MAG